MPKRGIEYLLSNEKRNLDVMGGVALAAALSPLGATIAIVAALDTKSPNPIYSHKRLTGSDGEVFTTLKFRTLSRNLGMFAADKTFGTFDPRASRIGQLVRRSGLDEVPQIINVLTGDMSLVGVRPLPDSELELYEAANPKLFEKWHPLCQISKPGLVGGSQIYRHHFRNVTTEVLTNSMNMDIAYIETASLVQDIGWLARTPGGLLRANIGVVADQAAQ